MNRPPVLLLGGADNVLSIARSLGRYGVFVRVAAKDSAVVRVSKYCREFHAPAEGESFDECWRRLLETPELFGSIVLCCSDESISFVAKNRTSYEKNFTFEENLPDLQLKLLDKQETIALANSAGIDAPAIFCGCEEIENLDLDAVRFPILVKPIHSYLYVKAFDCKLAYIETKSALVDHLADVRRHKLEVMLCEFIPGPDNQLCSYYSYFDHDGTPLFDYTKRVIRRFPENFGAGCYHISEHVPEAIEAGRQFFQGIGFVGLANVEFKLDTRDGRLKLIEANARFTAAQELLVHCGLDTARIVYDRLAGNPLNIPQQTTTGPRLWYPRRDFAAFRSLWRARKITLTQWLASIAHTQVLPKFDLYDPMPAVVDASVTIREALGRRL